MSAGQWNQVLEVAGVDMKLSLNSTKGELEIYRSAHAGEPEVVLRARDVEVLFKAFRDVRAVLREGAAGVGPAVPVTQPQRPPGTKAAESAEAVRMRTDMRADPWQIESLDRMLKGDPPRLRSDWDIEAHAWRNPLRHTP